uniref:Uncharacterized protein n=1 Tax=Arundo donax TaxID=35708 RepID=A0A0A8YIF6_ARUDO
MQSYLCCKISEGWLTVSHICLDKDT